LKPRLGTLPFHSGYSISTDCHCHVLQWNTKTKKELQIWPGPLLLFNLVLNRAHRVCGSAFKVQPLIGTFNLYHDKEHRY
jgi:hypothetical protein